MTAEIAILNKAAVALAADSAVTISAGRKEEKIFDSADKLFELSNRNPIGIMIFNGMNFMEAPLPSLIREFRQRCENVKTVSEAADRFLAFLDKFGKSAPAAVKHAAVQSIVQPVFQNISDSLFKEFREKVMKDKAPPDDPIKALGEYLDREIDVYIKVLGHKLIN